ncbi:hypothetical protein C8Q78DRAFT_1081365 [Trametes maxima]|nr:hypothetical protein C8Q78DRAFT_1081365 [Trametes maxima]
MSARMSSPSLSQSLHMQNGRFPPSALETYSSHPMGFDPPPGLSFPVDESKASPSISSHLGYGGASGPSTNLEVSQSGSAHVSASPSPAPTQSPALSISDFPALSAAAEHPALPDAPQASETTTVPSEALDSAAQEKAARKAAKKAASAERAAERARIQQEKAAARAVERERLAKEKAAEKERQAALKAEKEKAAKEKAEREKAERMKAVKEKAEREQAARERAAKEAAEKAERERAAEVAKAAKAAKQAANATKHAKVPSSSSVNSLANVKKAQAGKQAASPSLPSPSEVEQAPILAKMPKKNKPVTKPVKIPKDDYTPDVTSSLPSAATSDAPQFPEIRTAPGSSNNSRAHSVDWAPPIEPKTVQDMIQELHIQFPWLCLSKNPFFDPQKINPASKVPLEYGPLVHALSALSVGGGSFANNMPSTSIDNAVSSFQQLLETLTQTISDLLRLLPRTTWDDSSSFDGVLRDMLKGDDFLDDSGDDQNGQGKEDEVAALTLALERRARWMEVQLSKLEELHRDINTAAVRAILSYNDDGWDPHGSLPRLGNTLSRFDQIGSVNEGAKQRSMTANELEEKLVVVKERVQFVEAELKEVMQNMQGLRPRDEYNDM